ncbi:hypothetical protein TVAG_168140 [Trichomonas vaginalis G3]|uniref:Uncharacterized protein n=1 Tax=Trichomonas vaginalis (strain ATCC PRA-98 / G3) TaxID=412133 RepID=A2FBI2_TRIV3|nr:hypothetical protein TVAGG3_0129660 [Trichomonas vaginalis G3]EAX97717.1 hypothetical protein TVAG_168140 [Trichomonas vaginalis G3]KAI5546010.1 hypothetical protein TVAGG3_0129660 [Trichomonas vaginalis G3]|eukprot:XP_001310647.1 hypothetical protein [Trichomonas vaginalis G3]
MEKLDIPQKAISDFAGTSPDSARDIIGFFHHNLSQHTKEIAVINTALADLAKTRVDSEFKDNVTSFMEMNEQKIERLSTSFKLLTKQVFHNDASVQNMIDISINKFAEKLTVEKNNQDNNEIIDKLTDRIIELERSNAVLLERVGFLEKLGVPAQPAANQAQKKKVMFTNVNNICIFDCAPSELQFDSPDHRMSFQNAIYALTKQKEELKDLKNIINENNKRFGGFIQMSQDSFNNIDAHIKQIQDNSAENFNKIYKKFDLYVSKEELNFDLQGYGIKNSPSLGKAQNLGLTRPMTAISKTTSFEPCEQSQFMPPVSVTMISGDNLTRPATTQVGRGTRSNTRKSRSKITSH